MVKKKPIEFFLIEHGTSNRGHLRNRLVKEGILEYKCSKCGINSWLGKKLGLRLDHINGVNDDYRINNLRLLCPNCDSQTNTYCGKNKPKRKNKFCGCGKIIYYYSERCSKCEGIRRHGLRVRIPYGLPRLVVVL